MVYIFFIIHHHFGLNFLLLGRRQRRFFYALADKTIKLWKVSERDKKAEGYNLKEDSGLLRDPSTINTLRVIVLFKYFSAL
jgi:hypothetical protein